MKLSELRAIINSIDEDSDVIDVVIFVETETAQRATIVNFDKILVTDCKVELIPQQPIKLV